MSDPKSPADPPMEEILATVRRIIADDESGSSPPAARAAPARGSDVLECTEALEADGSIRHIPPFGAALRGPGESRNSPLGDGRIEPAAPNLVGGPSERGGPRLRASEPNRESEPRARIREASAPVEAPGREPPSPVRRAAIPTSPRGVPGRISRRQLAPANRSSKTCCARWWEILEILGLRGAGP